MQKEKTNERASSDVGSYPTEKCQLWLIFMCFLAYTVSYVSRYSYNSNIVVIRDVYGITKAEAGLVSTFYFFAYGIGQVVNGILCKRYNKKYCIAGALTVSAAANAILFFSPPFAVYKWLWLVNGAALSILWTSLLAILSKHLENRFLRRGIFMMSMSVAAGTCLSSGMSALFNQLGIYRFEFLFASVLAIAISVAWILSYSKLTRPAFGEAAEEICEAKSEDNKKGDKKTGTFDAWSIISVFVVPGILVAIVNLIKDGLNTWVPDILKSTFGYGNGLSIALTIVLPILGTGGSAVALTLNKKIKNFLSLSGVLYFAATICIAVITAILMNNNSGVMAGICTIIVFGLISLFMHALNSVMTSLEPLLLRDKYDSGMLAGILDGCAYVGSALSSYGLGAISDRLGGWNGVFILLLIMSAIAMAVGFLIPVIGKLFGKEN